MALGTVNPVLQPRLPAARPGGGGRPPLDRPRGGDWGGGRGGDGGAPDYGERLRRYRLGMAVALVSIVMLFMTVSTIYLFREYSGVFDPVSGTYVRNWKPVELPMALLVMDTIMLALSSVTIELARRQVARQTVLAPAFAIPGVRSDERNVPWLFVTVVLGLAFLAGQAAAWLKLVHQGWLVDSGASSSFFYLLTGTHAVHLVGGILALLYALSITWRRKPIEQRRIVIDVAAWYWHVIDVLWIYLFLLLAFAK